VATTGGALPEVVGTDGETGLLVPPNDPGALAGAIARLLDDPALRTRLGEAGRERVLGRFTWEVTARGTVEQYEALVAENGVTVPSGEGEAPQGLSEPPAPPAPATESVSTDTTDPTSTDTIPTSTDTIPTSTDTTDPTGMDTTDPTETVAC
jgi:hypothetical protein